MLRERFSHYPQEQTACWLCDLVLHLLHISPLYYSRRFRDSFVWCLEIKQSHRGVSRMSTIFANTWLQRRLWRHFDYNFQCRSCRPKSGKLVLIDNDNRSDVNTASLERPTEHALCTNTTVGPFSIIITDWLIHYDIVNDIPSRSSIPMVLVM